MEFHILHFLLILFLAIATLDKRLKIPAVVAKSFVLELSIKRLFFPFVIFDLLLILAVDAGYIH